MPTIDKFLDYLLADLPEEYPISSVPLSLSMTNVYSAAEDFTDAHRKELIFQQCKFLDAAEHLIEEQPWIAFIAAFKHLRLLSFFKTDTSHFTELADKEYFDRVQLHCLEILNDASSNLDEETKSNCERLVHFQVLHKPIEIAAEAVRNALSHGIISFEPPMPIPDQMPELEGCYPFLLSIVISFIVMMVSLAYWEIAGLFIAAVLIAVIFWVYQNNTKLNEAKCNKVKREKARYKLFNSLREEYYLCGKMLKADLSFPVEKLASDLGACATHLDDFVSDLESLKNTYIKPYV